jgi:Uncharacterised protein family (UPF0172)
MSTPKAIRSSIVIHPQACCTMAMHATQHRHDTVRGFLLGSVDEGTDTTQVRWAVPVAHGPVTGPLVELALGLCEAAPLGQDKGEVNAVVGWYTAPSLLMEGSASAVDARIASSLATPSSARTSGGDGGILLVMQNSALGSVLKGDDGSVGKLFTASAAASGGSAVAREVVVVESVKAARAAREAIQQGLAVEDFVDHLEQTSAAESTWLQYESLVDLIKKC